MATSTYDCIKCGLTVTETHQGSILDRNAKIICRPCSRAALSAMYESSDIRGFFGGLMSEVSTELCFCGRPKGHRGMHKGSKRGEISTTVAKLRTNGASGGYKEVLAQLREKRDQYSAAIEALEALG